MKLPISAIVVGYNEAALLQRSMPKLSFCQEILYFDLGSSDDSVKTAYHLGAKVIAHERVDSCEWVHAGYAEKTACDWVLITDPDEILSDALIDDIYLLFEQNILTAQTGVVYAPWIFYFKGRPLRGTHWGGISRRVLLAHNKRFEFKALIHAGRKLRPGYDEYAIEYNGENFIRHDWMQSYGTLLEKHLRYLRNEGQARYETGRRTSINGIVKEFFRSFRYSYIWREGYRDGFTGLFLSIFWTWYECSAQLHHYRYQKSMEKMRPKI